MCVWYVCVMCVVYGVCACGLCVCHVYCVCRVWCVCVCCVCVRVLCVCVCVRGGLRCEGPQTRVAMPETAHVSHSGTKAAARADKLD